MKNVSKICDPEEVAVKSFFLGPSAENRKWLESQVTYILDGWFRWREAFSANEGILISGDDKALEEFKAQQKWTEDVISNISKRFEAEIPKFSPRYIGHMFSEISMPALLGHIITLLHNPNNISSEASTVGTEIEKEAIEFLSNLIGFKKGVGHFTSGGTIANFEFLFRARERLAALNADRSHPDFRARPPVLLVSASKHYSWPKAMYYLGLGDENLIEVDLDHCGRMSVSDLERKLNLLHEKKIPLLGVVAIVGTTELGTVDPVKPIADLLEEFKAKTGEHIWLHLDAAYGGFFRSLVGSPAARLIDTDLFENLNSMSRADSVTLDPHKLGYVPYASGAFLCKNQEDYFMKSFTGPYIVSDRYNLGNFTIEGSRSAAGAVATYASMKSFSGSDGYARILGRTLLAKSSFKDELKKLEVRILFPEGTDTNILCFSVLGDEKSLTKINLSNLNLYEKIHSNGKYWISKTTLNRHHFTKLIDKNCEMNSISIDCEEMLLLRLTLMNPFVISKEGSANHAKDFANLILASTTKT